MSNTPGTLFIVATPIGNLGDLSPRAVATLRDVALILCEDTRHFSKLAAHYDIHTKVQSYHDHNEREIAERIVKQIEGGTTVALVSDAGTPLISDPGYRLVSLARTKGVAVKVIPGACAAIAALSICGFEIERFVFQGFVPQKPGKRQKLLREMLASELAQVFYESPYRIAKTFADLVELEPDREVFVARELTKLHEESFFGTAADYLAFLQSKDAIKGEFVVVLRGNREDRTKIDEHEGEAYDDES